VRVKKQCDKESQTGVSTPKLKWIILIESNDTICTECGKKEQNFIPFACNATTYGLVKLFGHKEFQLVIKYPKKEILYILNTLGLRVQAGEKFSDGDIITGIYEDCSVKLVEFEDAGQKVLRVIVPDKYCRFPDDPLCMDEYKHQLLTIDELLESKGGKK